MVNESSQPQPGDAVLGGQSPEPLINAAVLGGIEGAKQRCASPDVKMRIAGLREAVKYEEAGIELLLHGLKDEVSEAGLVAYSLLLENVEPELKRVLEIYEPYHKCLHNLTQSKRSDSYPVVAFSLDGQLLASCSDNKTIKLWDVETGKLTATLSGHSGPVYSVAFSPNGQFLASGSYNGIKLWDVETGELTATLTLPHVLGRLPLVFNPNGQILASGLHDITVKLWDVETGTLKDTLCGQLSHFSHPELYVAFSPNGQLVASGSYNGIIRLWNVDTGELIATLPGNSGKVYSAAFSPNGQLLASDSSNSTIKLWDVETGKLTTTLSGHSGHVYSLAFSPNSQLLASGSYDQTVKLWDVETGTLKDTFSGHSSNIKCVAFSSNGQLVASSSQDEKTKTIKLWGLKASNTNIVDPVKLFHSYLEIKQPQNSDLYEAIQLLNNGTKAEQKIAFSRLKSRQEPVVKGVLWSYINTLDPQVAYSRKLLKYFLALNRLQEAQEETEKIFLQELGYTGVEGINDTSRIGFLSAIYELWEIYAKAYGRVGFLMVLGVKLDSLKTELKRWEEEQAMKAGEDQNFGQHLIDNY